MFERRWIIDPALVITFLFCFSALLFVSVDYAYLKAKQNISEQSQSAADSDKAKAEVEKACSDFAGLAWRECALEAIQPAHQQSQDARDLHAQEWMARWAFWMFLASLGTVIITGVGVFYVKRTLDATLSAVEDTGQATVAMREANRIMQEGQRPWIKINFFHSSTTISDGSVHIGIGFNIENVGARPAISPGIHFKEVSLTGKDDAEQEQVMSDFFNEIQGSMRLTRLDNAVFPGAQGQGFVPQVSAPSDAPSIQTWVMVICTYKHDRNSKNFITCSSAMINVSATKGMENGGKIISAEQLNVRIRPGSLGLIT